MANDVKQMTLSGLGTTVSSSLIAGSYQVIGKLSLPGISKGDSSNSQVVTVVKQNSTTIYTSNPGDEGFLLTVVCAQNDIIQVILSSSALVDQSLNVVKGVVAIG